MKNRDVFRGLLCLVLTIGFFSCSDHRIPAVSPGSVTDRQRIKKIIREGPDQTAKVSLFQYDTLGRLSSIFTFQTPDSTVSPVETTVFAYNAQNRLTEARRDISERTGSAPFQYEIYTYTLNEAGQVVELRYVNNVSEDNIWLVHLQYHPDNRLKGSVKSFDPGGIRYRQTSSYVFTGNNLTAATINEYLFRVITLYDVTRTAVFTYDSKVNPFYGLYIIPAPFTGRLSDPHSGSLSYYTYYGGVDNLLTLSQNNMLSDGSTTYTYTYNSSNLPTSRIRATPHESIETLHYEYETY
ncbi:DUF4595 domain-containing protein [Larkinella sp. C7]|jgi:hypothetical protein|uniref:DUF4595 domain-containing protein n=1 Tax=Larkinella sp. C7 TaxID=2576607 RepID=UPI001111067C|nr:DUF4595 domain-containing protein [Larkinella sp. C7]